MPRPCPWPSLRSVSQGCGFYKLKARPSLSERTVTRFTAVHATVHEHRRCQTYRVPGVRVCSVEVTVGVGAGWESGVGARGVVLSGQTMHLHYKGSLLVGVKAESWACCLAESFEAFR